MKTPSDVFWLCTTCDSKPRPNEGCLLNLSKTFKWNISPRQHVLSFSLDKDTSGDENSRYVYTVAAWIQESCWSFVLIHPDKTSLSIPFENRGTGIFWNHTRSQECEYHALLKFYCFIHLFCDCLSCQAAPAVPGSAVRFTGLQNTLSLHTCSWKKGFL